VEVITGGVTVSTVLPGKMLKQLTIDHSACGHLTKVKSYESQTEPALLWISSHSWLKWITGTIFYYADKLKRNPTAGYDAVSGD
jgi:hypothetical protein